MEFLKFFFEENWDQQINRLIQRESKFLFTTDHTGFTEKIHGITDLHSVLSVISGYSMVKEKILEFFSYQLALRLDPKSGYSNGNCFMRCCLGR